MCLLVAWSFGAVSAGADAQQPSPTQPARRPGPPPPPDARPTVGEAGVLEPEAVVEGVSEFHLPNGLCVLLGPDPSESVVTVHLAYRVGLRDEARGERGLAALTQLLVCKRAGTHEHVAAALEEHGATLRRWVSRDTTHFCATLPATTENLDFALSAHASCMARAVITPEDCVTERAVLLESWAAAAAEPGEALRAALCSAAYLVHPYGTPPPGPDDSLESLRCERVEEFYRTYYRPDRAVLVVTGRFDPMEALSRVRKHFDPVKPTGPEPVDAECPEPPQRGERRVVIRQRAEAARVGVAYHVPAATHPDYVPLLLLADILTHEPSGRLHEALVSTGLAREVSARVQLWGQPSLLEITAAVAPGQDPQAVLDKLTKVVEGVAGGDVQPDEVRRAQTSLSNQDRLVMADTCKFATELARWQLLGDWRLSFLTRDRVQAAQPSDIRRVARDYLVATNRTTAELLPSDAPTPAAIPPAPEVTDELEGYRGRHRLPPGEPFLATLPNIKQRTQYVTLDNDIEVALLPKRTKGQEVQACLLFGVGTPATLDGRREEVALLPDLLKRGTAVRSHQALRDELDRLHSRIDFESYPGLLEVRVASDRRHLTDALELLAEMLRKPGFSAESFERAREDRRARYAAAADDSRTLALNALRRELTPVSPDHVLYVPSLDQRRAELDQVTLESFTQFYRENYHAGHLRVGIVGDFRSKQVARSLEQCFGSWEAVRPFEPIPAPYEPVRGRDVRIPVPGDGRRAWVILGTSVPISPADDAFAPLDLGFHILANGARARLAERLRYGEGIASFTGGVLRPQLPEDWSVLVCYAVCSSRRADQVQLALREEFERWAQKGITLEEVRAGRRSYLQRWNNELASDHYLAYLLAAGLADQRTLDDTQQQLDRINTLTDTEVNSALRAHVADLSVVMIQASPTPPDEVAE